jgi:hypothetical protein
VIFASKAISFLVFRIDVEALITEFRSELVGRNPSILGDKENKSSEIDKKNISLEYGLLNLSFE